MAVERAAARRVAGGELHGAHGGREPRVERHVLPQARHRALARLDGDHAAGLRGALVAHEARRKQRKVSRVGAHVDERVARPQATLEPACQRRLPRAGEEQPLGENVGARLRLCLPAAQPHSGQRGGRRGAQAHDCREGRARQAQAEPEQPALADRQRRGAEVVSEREQRPAERRRAELRQHGAFPLQP
eukprot:3341740-Prymnesium_polylepis.1